MEIQGSLKGVLDFDEADRYTGRYDGYHCFEGVLVPTPEKGLNLVKRNWLYSMDGDDKPTVYHYSVIHYRFDAKMGKYDQVGEEEDFPGGKDLGLWPNPILKNPLFFR